MKKTLSFLASRWTPRQITAWCKRMGFRPITGRLTGKVYRVVCEQKTTTKRGRPRRNPDERERLRDELQELRTLEARLRKTIAETRQYLGVDRRAMQEDVERRRNPRRRRTGKEIYPRLEAIEARKRDGKLYRHTFKSKPRVLGTKDGGLRIPRVAGKGPLWGMR